MASSGQGNDYGSVYVVLGILLLLVVRRFSRVIRGSRVSPARTVVYVVYYLGFAGLLIAVSVASGGVPPDFLGLYALVGAAGIYLAYHLANTRIGFWRGADGGIYYRGAILIYIVYLVALFARIAIDLSFIGPQAFTFTIGGPAPTLSTTAVDAGIVTDLLLCLGSGMLTGRNIRIMRRYRLITAGKEQITDAPPSVPLL